MTVPRSWSDWFDLVTLLSHAGQPDAEAESAAGQLTRELALPVELAIVVQGFIAMFWKIICTEYI